jgi:hypothetical protein
VAADVISHATEQTRRGLTDDLPALGVVGSRDEAVQ